MSTVLHRLSEEMGIEESELVSRGVRAYLRSELGKIEAQLYALCHKHGIKSIYELERAIEKGEVVESDVLDDLMRMDYLESEKTKLKNRLKDVK
ncbi:MAG: hypothetical protein GIS02_03030 [Methanosarcinales archaeon]|uniref:Uncharacterized protein n=1 Tax=Candidatus Ethanoperedens thermophilum TaxID=2766897 RepID=A0A848D9Z2_9EURY|nr:hypothetical protein [Candidatus Ethanoperedens thermophilum]